VDYEREKIIKNVFFLSNNNDHLIIEMLLEIEAGLLNATFPAFGIAGHTGIAPM